MKKLSTLIKHIFLIISLSFLTFESGFTQTITNSGLIFNPDTLQVTIGDNIIFNISASHNAVEVSETTFNNNGSTSNNGFNIPFGGGSWTADSIKTYYYVCQPHASMGMKGIIISNPPACNKSLTQQLDGFDPNPLYSPMQWSYDTLSLVNTSDCNIRIRPEFIISHDSLAIGANDLVLKWYNPYTGAWPAIPYNINSNGHAVGFWSSSGNDTTGQDINQGVTQQIIIRVKFWPSANYGNYSANWTTKEVDLNGNIIQTLATGDSTNLSLVDCSVFAIDSSYTTNISCNGLSDGEAGITSIANGSGNYTYSWSNGDTNSSTNNLTAGDYYCIITDLNWQQCTDSIGFSILETQLELDLTANNVVCYDDSTGSVLANAIGGTPPYYYLWNNGSTSSSISGLSAGNYSCTVTDANGCIAFELTPLTEGNQIFSNLDYTNATCFGTNDGNATVTPSGGSGALSILWWNGATNSSVTGLIPTTGVYWLQITDNNLSCVITEYFDISEPVQLTSSYTQTNVSCNGANDGSAVVTFFGGTIGDTIGDTNYILGWAGTTLPVYLPYPQNIFNTTLLPPPYNQIPPEVYPFTVTDLNGCTIFDTITITEPDSLYLNYSTTNFNGYEISCNGFNDGEIDIQVIGGTFPFDNYLNGTLQGSLISTNLADGTYTDSIIDVNGCTATATIILTEPFELVSTLNSTNISCNGICDGEITSSTSGGVSPYSFVWSPQNQTTNIISNLCPGNYTLNLTDGNGCSENVSTTITEPYPINFTIDSIFDISTYGGTDGAIYITANGGSGLLTYSWADPFNFTSSGSDIDSLNASVYGLVITDSNSCIFDTLIELSQPSSLTLFLDIINTISCFDSCDASIFITASGGDSTYTYNWSGPNNFTATTANIFNLCYGEYILELSDSFTTIIDTFNIYQPQPLSSILSADSILCHNGNTQAEINIWGGTAPFTYLWSNLDVNYITNLPSGNHSVIAMDQNGCSISNIITLSNPDSILAQTTTTHVSCNGFSDGTDSINVTSGGLTPYIYSNNSGLTYQNSNVFSNLSAGNYSYLITDLNGCLGSASTVISEPTQLTSITESDSTSCYDECDGIIYAIANGGTPPYSYNWGGSSSNLCPGIYNVTITDTNGCIASNSAIVYEPNPLIINIWINGNTIEATSGFTTYQWFNANGTPVSGATSEIFSPSTMDEYYVVVTDGVCEEKSYAIYYNVSGVNSIANNFKIYPNPTKGMIKIESNISCESISIVNTTGNQLLLVEKNNNDKGPTELDLSTFAKGIYFIQIEQNNLIMNYRIVLQ